MSFTAWLIILIYCAIMGTKSMSCIRHYMLNEKNDKATVKVVDLFLAIVFGLIPFLNILWAIVATCVGLFFIVAEVVEYNRGFFSRDLFGSKNDKPGK